MTVETLKLIGGALCLDFANSADYENGRVTQEYLHTYDDFLVWSQRVGVLSEEQVQHLRTVAQPERAAQVLEETLGLRDVIYRIFSAAVAGRTASRNDLEALNAAFTESVRWLRIVAADEGYAYLCGGSDDDLNRPLWSIVQTAAALLTSPELPLVRQCAADDCSYLFVDTSRNRSRRWCDMDDCGNRAKAKRHYRRTKQA